MRSISSQNNPSKKISPKLIVILIVLAVLLIGGVVTYLTLQKTANDSNLHSDNAGNNGSGKEDINTGPNANTPSDDIPIATSLKVTLTNLQQASGTVTIAGTVTGEGIEEGTCVAEFTTPEDRPVVKEVKAVIANNQATCGPVNIDEVEFSYLGDWDAKITYYTNDNKAQVSSEPKTITIK